MFDGKCVLTHPYSVVGIFGHLNRVFLFFNSIEYIHWLNLNVMFCRIMFWWIVGKIVFYLFPMNMKFFWHQS